MQVNSLSNVGIATQVWAQATRTLSADPATDAGAATLVWGHAARTVTTFSSGVVSSIHTTLSNGASVDLRPAASKFREILVIGEAAANVTWSPGLYDGVTARIGVAGASAAAIQVPLYGTSTFGPILENTGTVGGSYDVAGIDWIT